MILLRLRGDWVGINQTQTLDGLYLVATNLKLLGAMKVCTWCFSWVGCILGSLAIEFSIYAKKEKESMYLIIPIFWISQVLWYLGWDYKGW